MSSLSVQFAMDPERSATAAAITAGGGAYVSIGAPLTHGIRIFGISNLTDVVLKFSIDGVHDNLTLPSSGYRVMDVSANDALGQGWYIPVGTTFYARTMGANANTGSVFIDISYGVE
jgi:hypothetical protein